MSASVRGVSIDDREGSETANSLEYSATYKVTTTDKNDGPEIVRNAFGLPRRDEVYSVGNDFNPNAKVVSVDPRQSTSPTEWDVVITWTTDTGSQSSGGGSSDPQAPPIDNPLNEPPQLVFGVQTRRIIAKGRYVDPTSPPTDGIPERPLLMTNFEPVEAEVDIDEPVLSITRNVQVINPSRIMALANQVNSTPWQGAEERQLRLRAPRATSLFHSKIGIYWRLEWTIVYRFDRWDIRVPQIGSWYLLGGSKTARTRKWADGAPVKLPLKADGDLDTDAEGTGDYAVRTYRYYREIDFNSLGLL